MSLLEAAKGMTEVLGPGPSDYTLEQVWQRTEALRAAIAAAESAPADRARAARAARLQTSYGAQLVDAARANAFAATADRIRRAIATEKRRG